MWFVFVGDCASLDLSILLKTLFEANIQFANCKIIAVCIEQQIIGH